MRAFDFAPLLRSSIGFDHVNRLFELASRADEAAAAYPPYNIEKTAENGYRISIAVAGFTPDELTVEVKEATLVVSARKAAEETERRFLHRGIATRAFERRFALADHVRVTGALHEHGMLHIDLVRETPEALKPRRIAIATGAAAEAKLVEAAAV